MPGSSAESLQICLGSGSSFFAKLSADLSKAATQLVRIRVLGDSISRCWGAAGNAASSCAGAGIGPVTFGNLWVEQLRSWLNAHYPSHGSGLIPVVSGVPSVVDSAYYTLVGNISVGGNFTLGIPSQQNNGATFTGGTGIDMHSAATLSMKAMPGSTLNIYYVSYSTLSTAGFNIAIDGHNQGTFGTDAGAAAGYHMVSVPAPAGSASHTTQLTCNGGDCFIYALEWVTNPNGVAVDNLSVAACAAECFGANPNNAMAVIDLTNNAAHVYDITALGMNDYLRDANLAQYQTNMSGIVSHAQSTGVQSVLVFNMPWTTAASASGIDMNSIYSTAQSLAAANGYDYADVAHNGSFSNTAAMIAAGYYNPADQIHLSDAGQNALWNFLQTHLTATSYNWYPVSLGAALAP
jgi:hypothetical protein